MRRALLVLALFGGACGVDEATWTEPEVGDAADLASLGPTTRVRIVAGNLTTSGQDYDSGHGARIFQAVKPDIVLIQEFNAGNDSTQAIRAFVDSTFGPGFQYVRGADSEQIPNGVISRYPIRSRGNWSDPRVNNTRGFTWALIDAPGPVDVFAVSVHFATSSSGTRAAEASDLVSRIRSAAPSGAYVVIGGDLNTGSRTETALRNLSSVVVTAGPYPADGRGNGNTNENRNKPYDWVMVSPDLSARRTATAIGSSTFAAGLVVDTRVYSPIAELAPARSSDSGASGMQHMAVVRDFLFDADDVSPTPTLRLVSPAGGGSLAAGSAVEVRWEGSAITSVTAEYAADGVSFSTIGSGGASGAFTWTVPAQPTSAGRVRVVGGGLSAVSAPFSVVVAPAPGKVMINEILANEPGSDPRGEFVELYNAGASAVNLGGWTLSDAASVRHTFPAGTMLEPGKAVVVSGGAVAGSVSASTGTLGLSNSGDTVTLSSGGTVKAQVSYPSSLAGTDGVSMTRATEGDEGSAFVLHTSRSALSSSPGRRADGLAF